MDTEVANVVDAILTAILQWRVSWLDEQKNFVQPPPICRTQPKKLKITYDTYKDYESTFVPLLMHEIWAQIFEEWTKFEAERSGLKPMDIDDLPATKPVINLVGRPLLKNREPVPRSNQCVRSFWIGVADYRGEGAYQCKLKCQYLIESNKIHNHLKLIGDGDLVRLDLSIVTDPTNKPIDSVEDPVRKTNILSLFAYVVDVSTERLTSYTHLAECFVARPNDKGYHVVNYHVVIAKRPLRLKLSEPMKITGIYYLKPMIRQVESVAILKESALASDILSPRLITCQISVPTIVSIKSAYYNDMQYRAIIGANEALVRSIPKIQLIQGPPGTGKTHTLIGIIKHFYLNWQNLTKAPKILICAPSNGAIDEVSRRLYREREFLKKSCFKRSLRMVRVGHPDQISQSIKMICLDELVESNTNFKAEGTKQKHLQHVKELEDELSRCDTEISNLRFTKRFNEIPEVEAKIARLLKDLDAKKASTEVNAKREVSEAAKRQVRFELIKNADVILTTLNSCQRYPLDVMFKGDRAENSFHCVIVDEASQCCEPELLMPLCYKISKMILIGDPMQLPATVISRYAQEFDFGRSLFERFFNYFGQYSTSSPIAMLTDQYRMHPDICHFPSFQFYDNRLRTARDVDLRYPLSPYIVFDIKHGSEAKSNKNSLENQAEAGVVRNLLLAVLTMAPENSEIGVITPYKGQKRLITNRIENLRSQRNITVDVNTCDGFQGQEKDIIILSCVRASDIGNSIGFLKSYQRINVALTRARHSLIVLVSTKSLTKDKTWKALVDDAINRNRLQVLTQTPSSSSLSSMISSHNQYRSYGPPTNGIMLNSDDDVLFIPMDID